MGIFSMIKQVKDEHKAKSRAKVQEEFKDVQAELKLAQVKGQVVTQDAKARKGLRQAKKDLFEAKHPIISGALRSAGEKIKENRKKNKGIFAQSNTASPFLPTGTSPFGSTSNNNPFGGSKTKTKKKTKKRSITINF